MMDSLRLDQNRDSSGNTHVQKLLPPYSDDSGEAGVALRLPSDSYNAGDTFGEPEIIPRIGEEYQAELPQLIGDSDTISHISQSTDAENRADADQNFLVGSPINLMWISSDERDKLGSRSISKTSSGFTHSDPSNINKMEVSFGELEPSHDSRKSIQEWQNLPSLEKICESSGQGYRWVPGFNEGNWNAAEKDCFLLGLYIFEKDFVKVKQFVGTKEMGALLSYYYGKFYSSPEYHGWSRCRKMKKKKGILGKRIFSGLRQQQLLSRIFASVSDECRNAVLEVSRTFGDEKMPLADYVFSLKAMVGTNVLVNAVGIGKGKQDLTGVALEPSRSNQVFHMPPAMPMGKACSSLTTTEIISYLSGNYRLSKARSSELFWEAVWPRLLARGWHSEQPKKQGYVTGSKASLVFLVPGIKKFSRRKLAKGDDYFDSATDVLSRVAQEPRLIELKEEVEDSKRREESEATSDRNSKPNDDDLPTSQQHFYLQPGMPNHNAVVMKFTVVDTSLSDDNVRESRSLPPEISGALIAPDPTEDSDEDTPGENVDESDATNRIMANALATDASLETTKSDEEIIPGKKKSNLSAVDRDARTAYPDIHAELIPDKSTKEVQENAQVRSVSESLLSRALEQENEDYTAPITKQSRTLIGFGQEESQAGLHSSSAPPRMETWLSNRCSDTHEITEHLSSQVSTCLDKLPSTSSTSDSPCEHIENSCTPILIDLNLPQPEPEDGLFPTESNNEQDVASRQPDDHRVPNSDSQAGSEEQSNLNPRRHSKRIRPLTTRALEAVAHGYLTVNRRRKRKEASSDDGRSSRPSQRGRDEPSENASAPQTEAAENGASSSGNSNVREPPSSST